MKEHRIDDAKSKSLKIITIYLVIGIIWIVGTDILSNTIFTDIPQVYAASTVKGIFYVLITAVIFYLLIYSALKKVLEKQSLLKSLIDSTEDWIFYVDTHGRYLGCNKAFERYANMKEEDFFGQTPEQVFGQNVTAAFSQFGCSTSLDNSPFKFEEAFTYPDGRQAIIELIKTTHLDIQGNVAGVIGVGRDITERKIREESIQYLGCHDALTGLYNRANYESEKQNIDTEENLPISVIVCDVDGLKLVNDAFGHVAGDHLLITAAEILKNACKESDVAVRTGGDEFCVFFPRTGNEEIEPIFEAINNQCQGTQMKQNDELQLTSISMGFAVKETGETSLDEVILEAEEYMYRRKLLGRKGTHSTLMKSIMATLHEKSYETQEHCNRMATLARQLGRAVKLSGMELDILELAASLHDIGKISIDLSILQKSGKLTEEEWGLIKKHPEVGWRITQAITELNPISDIVLFHHERWDGTGYPRGLRGEEIPVLARIIAIVDAYDAMIEERPYRGAMSIESAKTEILRMAGTQFDAKIAKIFVEEVLSK